MNFSQNNPFKWNRKGRARQKQNSTLARKNIMTKIHEIVSFNSNENREIVASAISVFDPRNVKDNIDDAEIHLKTVAAVGDALSLASYRVIYDVYHNETWKNASYFDSKGIRKKYATFKEWCEKAVNLKKSQAYNAVTVGEYITEDGQHTILPHGEKDYSFTHLVELFGMSVLYETVKDENGKKERKMRDLPAMLPMRTRAGKLLRDEDGAFVYEPEKNENGAQIIKPALYVLAQMLIIKPEMSVAKCKQAIKEYFKDDIEGDNVNDGEGDNVNDGKGDNVNDGEDDNVIDVVEKCYTVPESIVNTLIEYIKNSQYEQAIDLLNTIKA